uniref:SHOCT domain-containing protein n=2 Tax=Streptomyces TaxID=1883 RepID=UPI001EE7D18D
PQSPPAAPALEGPRAPGPERPAPPGPAEDDHDALLRRLRELGELHRSGILTDEEFTLAKQAVLKRM